VPQLKRQNPQNSHRAGFPNDIPKAGVYAALAELNLDFEKVLVDLERLGALGLFRRRRQQYSETRAFDPFDRLARQCESQGKSLDQLVDEFVALRAVNLDELRALNLDPEDLRRRGMHPALGVVTLSQLLATWAAHDLTHLHQIPRIMAHQYRAAVGPWSPYLGVLRCAGHSF